MQKKLGKIAGKETIIRTYSMKINLFSTMGTGEEEDLLLFPMRLSWRELIFHLGMVISWK